MFKGVYTALVTPFKDGKIDELDDLFIDAMYDNLSESESEKPIEDYIKFKADGNATAYAKYKDGDEDIEYVKYEISGNKLYIKYLDENGNEDGDVDEAEFSINGNTLTMTFVFEWTTDIDGKKHTRYTTSTYTKR